MLICRRVCNLLHKIQMFFLLNLFAEYLIIDMYSYCNFNEFDCMICILVYKSYFWLFVPLVEVMFWVWKHKNQSDVVLYFWWKETWLRCCLCIISYDTRKYFVIKKMSHVTFKAVFSFGLIIWSEPYDPTSSAPVLFGSETA